MRPVYTRERSTSIKSIDRPNHHRETTMSDAPSTGSSSVRSQLAHARRNLDSPIQGIKSRHRKKAEQMKPGDRIVYYCTGVKAFAGVATITSTYFESDELIWKSANKKRAGEEYPFRVHIERDLALDG